jgi:hypothetical protein
MGMVPKRIELFFNERWDYIKNWDFFAIILNIKPPDADFRGLVFDTFKFAISKQILGLDMCSGVRLHCTRDKTQKV